MMICGNCSCANGRESKPIWFRDDCGMSWSVSRLRIYVRAMNSNAWRSNGRMNFVSLTTYALLLPSSSLLGKTRTAYGAGGCSLDIKLRERRCGLPAVGRGRNG